MVEDDPAGGNEERMSEERTRQQIIDGQASRAEAERFIVDLERALASALDEAASATTRLAQHKTAAAELVRGVPRIAGEDDRLTRLDLAQEAIDQHEATAGE